MVSPEEKVLVWIKYRANYVEHNEAVHLRLLNPSKMGTNMFGMSEGKGELVELSWSAVLDLRPSSMEIRGELNPLHELVGRVGGGRQVLSLRSLSFVDCDVSVDDVCSLLDMIERLGVFSFTGVQFTNEEWKRIAEQLTRLNTLGISLGGGPVDVLVNGLSVQLVHFAGTPGVRITDIETCPAPFVTVQYLLAKDFNFSTEDAERFLRLLPEKFPRLKVFVLDWNIVDPAVTWDTRTEKLIEQLVQVNNTLHLETLAILVYTPCDETKAATDQICCSLSKGDVQHILPYRFATSGIPNAQANFTLIVGGKGPREALLEMFVTKRSSLVGVSEMECLLNERPAPTAPSTVVDFTGFDTQTIRKYARDK